MSLSEYYESDLETVLDIVQSFYEFQNNKEQQEWERTRFVSFMTIKPHDSKKRLKKPSDLIKFKWELEQANTDKLELKEKIKTGQKKGFELYTRLKKLGLV